MSFSIMLTLVTLTGPHAANLQFDYPVTADGPPAARAFTIDGVEPVAFDQSSPTSVVALFDPSGPLLSPGMGWRLDDAPGLATSAPIDWPAGGTVAAVPEPTIAAGAIALALLTAARPPRARRSSR